MSFTSSPDSFQETLIIGGGPAGCLLALELNRRGLPSSILDARWPDTPLPDRTLALSWLTVQTLARYRILEPQSLTPIRAIQVGQRTPWSGVKLTADDANVDALGYTIRYSTLQKACENAIQQAGIPFQHGIRINKIGHSGSWGIAFGEQADVWMRRAVVLAEGGSLKPEGWRYQEHHYEQSAWIAFLPKLNTHGIAYERFTDRGILAFLPEAEGTTLIFSLDATQYEAWCELDRASQNHWLARQCPASLDWSSEWTLRAKVPLRFQALRSTIEPPLWVIGNAAQIMHPVAGLGFNLGVRDVLDTAISLHQFFRPSVTSDTLDLASIHIGRHIDRRFIQSISHALARWGHYHGPGWRHARAIGLTALQAIPPLKSALLQSLIWGF